MYCMILVSMLHTYAAIRNDYGLSTEPLPLFDPHVHHPNDGQFIPRPAPAPDGVLPADALHHHPTHSISEGPHQQYGYPISSPTRNQDEAGLDQYVDIPADLPLPLEGEVLPQHLHQHHGAPQGSYRRNREHHYVPADDVAGALTSAADGLQVEKQKHQEKLLDGHLGKSQPAPSDQQYPFTRYQDKILPPTTFLRSSVISAGGSEPIIPSGTTKIRPRSRDPWVWNGDGARPSPSGSFDARQQRNIGVLSGGGREERRSEVHYIQPRSAKILLRDDLDPATIAPADDAGGGIEDAPAVDGEDPSTTLATAAGDTSTVGNLMGSENEDEQLLAESTTGTSSTTTIGDLNNGEDPLSTESKDPEGSTDFGSSQRQPIPTIILQEGDQTTPMAPVIIFGQPVNESTSISATSEEAELISPESPLTQAIIENDEGFPQQVSPGSTNDTNAQGIQGFPTAVANVDTVNSVPNPFGEYIKPEDHGSSTNDEGDKQNKTLPTFDSGMLMTIDEPNFPLDLLPFMGGLGSWLGQLLLPPTSLPLSDQSVAKPISPFNGCCGSGPQLSSENVLNQISWLPPAPPKSQLRLGPLVFCCNFPPDSNGNGAQQPYSAPSEFNNRRYGEVGNHADGGSASGQLPLASPAPSSGENLPIYPPYRTKSATQDPAPHPNQRWYPSHGIPRSFAHQGHVPDERGLHREPRSKPLPSSSSSSASTQSGKH